jgi:hypothetical protein
MMASITKWISSAGYARLVEIFSGKEVAVLFDGTADANHTYQPEFDSYFQLKHRRSFDPGVGSWAVCYYLIAFSLFERNKKAKSK